MNPVSLKEAEKLSADIVKNITNLKKTEIVLCPPFLYLEKLKKSSKKVFFGAQNAFAPEVGAFTGEISAKMLVNLGLKYVILGHSERRNSLFTGGESNSDVNKKVKAVLANGAVPIVCIGESARDGEHEYLNFVKTQLLESLEGVSKTALSGIIIAYEPVWAIGTNANRSATPAEFLEMVIFIRKILSDKFGTKNIEGMRIVYGGSVHPDNALLFLEEGKADGFLVGRDSIDAKKFTEIIKIAEYARN